MPKQIFTLTMRVVSNQDDPIGVAEMVSAKDWPLPNTTLRFPDFKKFSKDTLVEATLWVENAAVLLHKVVPVTELATAAEPDATDIPTWTKIGTEYFSPEERDVFSFATEAAKQYGNHKLMLTGIPGYGKTSRAKAWALAHNMEYVRVDCSSIRDQEEWMVYRNAANGSTYDSPTRFATACQKGNAVIVLDEISRLEPYLSNPLIPILDFDHETHMRNQTFSVADNIIFVATMNVGYQFTGTFSVDSALKRRFDTWLEIGAPPADIEAQILMDKFGITSKAAGDIIRVLRVLRNKNMNELQVATDCAIKLALLVKLGQPLRRAVQSTIINAVQCTAPDVLKEVLDTVNSELHLLKS